MKHLMLFAVLCLFAGTIFAATVWEQPTIIKQYYNIEWYQSTAVMDDGSLLFVWSDVHSGNRDIYAKAVDTAGNPIWQQPVVVDNKTGLQEYPAVAKTSTGDFVIAWADFSTNHMGTIYTQKINNQGQLQWQTGGIEMCDYPGGAMDVQIIPGANGSTYIIWSDNRNLNRDAYAQHLDANGNKLWQEDGIPLADYPTDEPEFVAMADNNGGFVVGYRQNLGDYTILRAKRFNAQGMMTWNAPVVLNDPLSNGSDLQMAFANSETIVFTWTARETTQA